MPLYDPQGRILATAETKGSAVAALTERDTLPASFHGFSIERKWIGQLEAGGITAGWVRLMPRTEEAREICKRAGAPEVLGCSGEISPATAATAKAEPAGGVAEEIFVKAFSAAAVEIEKFVR